MRIYVIDIDPESTSRIAKRVAEAVRQSGARKIEVLELQFETLAFHRADDVAAIAFLGPSCYQDLSRSVAKFRSVFPNMPLAVVLDNEIYALEAVELSRELAVRTMAIADIAQMAQFVLDASASVGQQKKSRGIVATVQLKGGVGASTLSAALASVWARHSLSVCLVDLDDTNPQITEWGRVSEAKRKTVADLLREGRVPAYRLNELVHPIEGHDGRLGVIGQPEFYHEAFHFKADVIDGAPSSAEYINSLLECLQDEFDVVIVDTGRSWGISTFACLPHCQHVLFVTDDDGMSLRRSLDSLLRVYRESDDPDEFDLTRWSLVLNAYTGQLLSPGDVSEEVDELEIFPSSCDLYTIPFSESGRLWGAPGKSLYEMAEVAVKEVLTDLAFSLVPFRREWLDSSPISSKIRRQIQKLVAS